MAEKLSTHQEMSGASLVLERSKATAEVLEVCMKQQEWGTFGTHGSERNEHAGCEKKSVVEDRACCMNGE